MINAHRSHLLPNRSWFVEKQNRWVGVVRQFDALILYNFVNESDDLANLHLYVAHILPLNIMRMYPIVNCKLRIQQRTFIPYSCNLLWSEQSYNKTLHSRHHFMFLVWTIHFFLSIMYYAGNACYTAHSYNSLILRHV